MEEIINYLISCKHKMKNSPNSQSDSIDLLIKLTLFLEHANVIGKVNNILMLPVEQTGQRDY